MLYKAQRPGGDRGTRDTVFGESSKSRINYTTSTATDKFRTAMLDAGLACRGEIIPDGKLRRVHIEGDKHQTRNGWYVLHLDRIPAGAFGSWKLGLSQNWCAADKANLSYTEHREYQARLDSIKCQREAELTDSRTKARGRALSIWRIAQPVKSHPYLSKKRVCAYGIRQYKNCLVIPLRDTQGAIHSLQFIGAEGNKRFLKGGAISGHYHPIGQYQGTLCVCEGYATSSTVHQATGHAVACAFNASNLKPVALALRGKFPDAKLIICADNDRFTPGNPGVTKAREAAMAVNGCLVVPRFDDLGPFDFYQRGPYRWLIGQTSTIWTATLSGK
jgi:putative DNA primase/helicase